MKRNDQKIYEDYANSIWKGTYKFQRLLANQVNSRLEYFSRIVNSWKGMNVLDLGCGGGFMSEALTNLGANVIGVDPSSSLIEAAKEHARTNGLKIRYCKGCGETIPIGNDSVDCVVCVDVLEHVEHLKIVICEIGRVLKTSGIFLFDTINRNWFSKCMVVTIMEDVFRIIPRGAHDPAKFIKPNELKQYLKEAGFTYPDKFVGLGIIRISKYFNFEIGLTNSTRVMYIGYARKT